MEPARNGPEIYAAVCSLCTPQHRDHDQDAGDAPRATRTAPSGPVRRNLRKSWGAAAVGKETALLALGGRRYSGEAGRAMMAGPRSTPVSL
jgi:hypothetical protein